MSEIKEAIKVLRREEHNIDSFQLKEKDAGKNPILLFEKWMGDAIKGSVPEPNAMTLATVDKKGFPNARVVLLRGFDKNGFSFFTNYNSNKAKDLAGKKACLNFFWIELSRQVRIKGKVKKLSARETDDYFNSRPRESQIGAWASPQSEVISGRDFLEDNFRYFEKKFKRKNIPRPPNWGGYLLVPRSIEFWQGRPNRLHDRLLYIKQKTGWKRVRLAP